MAEPEETVDWPGSPFDGAPIIYSYTRAQALEDGVLIDAGELAREAGFVVPVALTAAAWADCVAWDEANSWPQDETGRLWDVLFMSRFAAMRARARDEDRIDVELLRVPNKPGARRAVKARLVAVCGPGDDAEPVVTIMEPGES